MRRLCDIGVVVWVVLCKSYNRVSVFTSLGCVLCWTHCVRLTYTLVIGTDPMTYHKGDKMTTFTTYQDAKAKLAEIIAAQPGSYDLDAIADEVIVAAEPTESGAYQLRLLDEEEDFWNIVIEHALD